MVYDVIVCGGGVAGVAAAIAAARTSDKVLLVEREYSLGGLATLGLICIYLPLCDGKGNKMSGGLAEELLKLSLKYGPGKIPDAWLNPNSTKEERTYPNRYRVTYNPASFIIAMEEELLNKGVEILYGSHISGVKVDDNNLKSIYIETKTGRQEIHGKTFIDATGDADICYYAGEETIDDNNNRKTGWYFSYDNKNLVLNKLSDPLYTDIPPGSRLYSGVDMKDITQNCIDGREMILDDILKKKKGNKDIYPLIIPSFHGLRMTRRLKSDYYFTKDDNGIFYEDSIGMIGNWHNKKDDFDSLPERYSLPVRIIETKTNNLYVAGRCVPADEEGQDLTRVIPSCVVTGEAAGTMASYQAIHGKKPEIKELQDILKNNGALIDSSLFNRIV